MISEKLKNARKAKKLSIKDLSKLSGISVSTIINIEKNYHLPNIKTLYKLCSFLDLDFEEIIKEKERTF